MKIYMFIFLLAVVNIYLVLLLKHEVHMFQQNSYMYSRYIKWYIKKSSKSVLIKGIFGLVSIILSLLGYESVAYVFLGIYLLLIVILTEQKPDKKKLVYTNRVKRLIVTISIILALNILFSISSYFDILMNIKIYMIVTIFLISLPQIIVIIANALIKPIETLINLYYIQDANRILHHHKNLKVIGITGSYGKTSTKNILKQILSMKYNVLMTPESYNTTLGVVRTIRESLKGTHEIFIVEMGAKKRYDVEEICNLIEPIYGIITSIGAQHLETFKSIENITKTKFELFDSLPSYGVGFVNKDDERIMGNLSNEQKRYVFYGMNTKDCDYYLYDIKNTNAGTGFKVRTANGEKQEFSTKLLGKHNLYNILCAISCANTCGMSLEEISYRVKDLHPIEHRLELKRISEHHIIIDDAYNSNPEGSREALNVLASFKEYRRILITPGMVELGERQDELNREFGVYAASTCDNIILVGEKQTLSIYDGLVSARFDMDNCIVTETLNDALLKLKEIRSGKDVILFENDLPDIYN